MRGMVLQQHASSARGVPDAGERTPCIESSRGYMQERHDAIAENGTCDDRSARFLAQSSLSSSLKVEAHFGPVKWLRAFACGALAVLRRHERRQFRRGFGDPGARCTVRVGRRGRATAFAAERAAPRAKASAVQDTHETLALRATRRSGSIGFDRIRLNSKRAHAIVGRPRRGRGRCLPRRR